MDSKTIDNITEMTSSSIPEQIVEHEDGSKSMGKGGKKIVKTKIDRSKLIQYAVQIFLLFSNLAVLLYVSIGVKGKVEELDVKINVINQFYDAALIRVSVIDSVNGATQLFNENVRLIKEGLEGFDRLSLLKNVQSEDIRVITDLSSNINETWNLIDLLNKVKQFNTSLSFLSAQMAETRVSSRSRYPLFMRSRVNNQECNLLYSTNFSTVAMKDGVIGEYYSYSQGHFCEIIKENDLFHFWMNSVKGPTINATYVNSLQNCFSSYSKIFSSTKSCFVKQFYYNCYNDQFGAWNGLENVNICS